MGRRFEFGKTESGASKLLAVHTPQGALHLDGKETYSIAGDRALNVATGQTVSPSVKSGGGVAAQAFRSVSIEDAVNRPDYEQTLDPAAPGAVPVPA